jgi:YcxB-like protein
MEIQYNITETDYVKSAKLCAEATRKQLILLTVVGLVLLLIGIFGPSSLKGMGYGGFFGGILGYLIMIHIITPWNAKRNYKKYKSIQEPLKISLIEGGFTITAANGHSNVKWENLLKWREDISYILVFFAPKMFYLVPKRIADSGFDMECFTQALRDKLGNPV